ncbi:unnamed protein product [Sphenostylis stenocarpa]|uniref:Protein kinase domain-containing protein n=1 Tax=Sphenostylis stenocarpa TaxID=92480 RepID=A0AA86RSG4_9FABA|nr:unnamed protein product [Sphenostylis stenocarpa]
MANSGASRVHSFASILEYAIKSMGGDLGALPRRGFALAVEDAWNSMGGDLGALPVHAFASIVENAISSISGDLGISHSPVHSFASIVENAISSISGDLGTSRSPNHGFASTVENAINSITGDLGTSHSPVHDFASILENAISSITGDSGISHSPVHGFAPTVENAIRSIAGDSEISHSPVHGFQVFTLVELAAATNNFSVDNMIGGGSFSVVYRGKLVDGSEVAIERDEMWSCRTHMQSFLSVWWRTSDLTFLSGLRPKNMVGLVGLCEEKDERLLVYEFTKNGSLYNHLHCNGSNALNSWKMRIKIALDASRGIEYLHKYGVPSTIHGDIRSSKILLDADWTAKVCNFGKAAGTIGYIDPEYLTRHVLTEKSDVYGFGVVLLELLTGKRPICGEDGGTRSHVITFAEPAILAGDFVKILDPRVGKPRVNEAKAVQLMAYTAISCVNVKGFRPTIADVVVNLERAFGYFW